MKRRFLPILALGLALLLGVFSPAAVFAEGVTTSTVELANYVLTEYPCGLTLSFNGDTATSRGFSWVTSGEVNETLLYLVESDLGEEADFSAAVEYTGRRIRDSYERDIIVSHQVEATGLTPGATYSYKAGGDGYFTYGTFTMQDTAGEIVILNLTDSQTREAELLYCWENAVQTAVQTAGGASRVNFVAFSGDLSDKNLKIDGEKPPFERKWCGSLDTVRAALGGIPWVAASGNHDLNWKSFYGYIYDVEEAGSTDYSQYYSVDVGNVHCIVLDSNQGVEDKKALRQLEWCEADLATASENPDTDWIMVVLHNGPYTTGDHGDEDSTREITLAYAPLFSKYHVDLVMQGHDHVFTKTLPYRWDSVGYTETFDDDAVVNFEVQTVTLDSVMYDNCPDGTYYVCPGAAGHRVGEADGIEFATAETGKYLDSLYKKEVGTVLVNSSFYTAGNDSTGALAVQMFGLIRADGKRLVYDFYVAKADGTAELLDTLAICKDPAAQQTEADRAADAMIQVLESLPYAQTATAEDLPAIVAAVQQYYTMDESARGALCDLYKNQVAAYLAMDGINEAFADAVLEAGLLSSELIWQEDGTCTVRLVAAMRNTEALACGFTVTVGDKTVDWEATTVYTGAVTANPALGLQRSFQADGGRLYALTLTAVPAEEVLAMQVSCWENVAGQKTEIGACTLMAVQE